MNPGLGMCHYLVWTLAKQKKTDQNFPLSTAIAGLKQSSDAEQSTFEDLIW